MTTKLGTKHFREGLLRYSGNLSGRASLSLTAGYREDEGSPGVNDYRRIPKITGRVKYRLPPRSVVHFFAGANDSEIGLDTSRYTSTTDAHVRSNYQMIKWEHAITGSSDFHVQVDRTYAELHTSDRRPLAELGQYNLELQHSFSLGTKQKVIWGATYRYSHLDCNYLDPKKDNINIVGLFVQDAIRIAANCTLFAGIKFEDNSFTKHAFSPRISLLYEPLHGHHFRLSLARAYRNPTFVENSMQTFIRFMDIPVLLQTGNEHLDSERMTALELGYRTTLFNRLDVSIELYYNEHDRSIELTDPVLALPPTMKYKNKFDAVSKGMEVSLTLPLTPWWTCTGNYTYQDCDRRKKPRGIQGTPLHKINLGSRLSFNNGFSLDVRLHFVDETRWYFYRNIKADDYLRLDVRIARTLFNDRLELALVCQNLTDTRHPEYSDGVRMYEADRLIYGQISVRFP